MKLRVFTVKEAHPAPPPSSLWRQEKNYHGIKGINIE
jgi:hypothetical protein